MVQHQRLGIVRWELPGGHVDPNETVAQAAVRETLEETGLRVRVGVAVAEAKHTWDGRAVQIVYFAAEPLEDVNPPPATEEAIRAIGWVDPLTLDPREVSPLAYPVVSHVARRERLPLRFEATHHETTEGWEPVVIRSWRATTPCQARAER